MKHSEILTSGTAGWNRWRVENPSLLPNLRGALLRGRNLHEANLDDANLIGADLTAADLRNATFVRADLRGALFTSADLRDADLRSAVLSDITWSGVNSVVDITGADFTGALLGRTIIGDIYLNRITGIGQIRHAGPSYISTSTLEFTIHELKAAGTIRTDVEAFLIGAGVLLDFVPKLERSVRAHPFCSAFISYSHADKAFALWLHQKLQDRGVRCWLDEKNIKPGDRILNAVGEAIARHDRILLCCSKSSLESWWVQDEIRKVQELERQRGAELRIVPLLLDDYLLQTWNNGLASDLRSRLGLDFKSWAADGDFGLQLERLFEALKKIAG